MTSPSSSAALSDTRAPSGRLTTHVLDTVHGKPAAGMAVVLWRQQSDGLTQTWVRVKEMETNLDGRMDEPVLIGEALVPGVYQLVFDVAAYFRSQAVDLPDPPFLDQVPLVFGMADVHVHYHVPLLVSPWAYSTYRGS